MLPDIRNARRPSRWAAALAFHDAHRRTINATLLALLVLQIAGMMVAARHGIGDVRGFPVDDDSPHYLDAASRLRTTHTFTVLVDGRLQPEAWRPLGYPVFLALLETVTGPHPLAIAIVQEGLFFIAVVLVGRFCARFHPAGETTFLCLVLAYPQMTWTAATIMAEGVCIVLVVLGTACLLASRRRQGAIAAGILFGLTAWFRANLFLLGTAAGLGMALLGKKRAWTRGFTVAAVSLAVMLPNSVRNYRLFGSASPLPYVSGMGPPLYWLSLRSLGAWNDVNLLRGDVRDAEPLLGGTGAGADAAAAAQMESIAKAAHGSDSSSLDDLATFPTVADQRTADRLLRQDAVRNIRGHPWPYIAAVAANLFTLWIPNRSLNRFPRLHALLVGCDAVIALLGFCGMYLSLRRPNVYGIPEGVAAAATVMCLYVPASVCLFLRQNRYTLPVGLLLLGFAALALTHLIALFATRGQGTRSGATRDCAAVRP